METQSQDIIPNSPEPDSNETLSPPLWKRRNSAKTPAKETQPHEKPFCVWRLPKPEPIRFKAVVRVQRYLRPLDELLRRHANLPVEQQAQELIKYFDTAARIQNEIAAKSLRFAPMPKPILASAGDSGANTLSLSIIENESPCTSNGNTSTDVIEDLYVSRSGRQCKRKTYNEEDNNWDLEIQPPNKSNKRNKLDLIDCTANSNDDPDLKITFDDPFIPDKNHNHTYANKVKTTQQQQQQRQPLTPLTRADRLIAKATSTPQTRESLENERFISSLGIDDDEDDELQYDESDCEQTIVANGQQRNDVDVVEEVVEGEPEEKVERRRVVPPLPMIARRRPIKQAKQNTQKKTNEKSEETNGTGARHKLFQSSEVTEKTVPCPICNNTFSVERIQAHASTCGEIEGEPAETSTFLRKGNVATSPKMSVCPLCDAVFSPEKLNKHMEHCALK